MSDKDCDGQTAHCDSDNACVQCAGDDDCSTDERCERGQCEEPGCSPGATRCSDNGAAVLTCSTDGQTEVSTDCASDAPCVVHGDAAACADFSCPPNSFSCSDGTLLICSDDGTTQAPFHECEADEYCDARRALCLPRICNPGDKSCQGAVLEVCNEDGSELTEELACSLTEECTPSGCEPVLCVPHVSFCSDGDVWQCGADAISAAKSEECGSDRYCLEHDGQAECSDQQCFPGDGVCDDGVATTCKPDGSGPKPGGDACSDGEICFAGTCRDQVCTPGSKLCDHENVYLCADNGTDRTLFKTCQSNEFCDPDSGACAVRVCTPGLPGCFGTILATCSDDGSKYEAGSVDCATTGKVCDTGSCVPKVCEPYASSCIDNAVIGCNGTGSGYGPYPYPCSQGTFCAQQGNNAGCVSQVCTPGEPACDGTRVSTCNTLGSAVLPADASADCKNDGKVCELGQCKAKLCEPNGTLCADGNLQRCNASGASYARERFCLSDEYCKVLSSSSAECQHKLCVAGQIGCLEEAYGECADDGISLEPGSPDCADKGEVCTLQGCASSVLEEVGDTMSFVNQYYDTVLDTVHVTTSRKLIELQAYLALPATRTLRWVVYAPAQYGYWNIVFDQVTTSTGTQFHSSGPMAFVLEAGKDYLIGVRVSGGSFVAYSDSGGPIPRLSFGSWQWGASANFAESISPQFENARRPLRVTTALP